MKNNITLLYDMTSYKTESRILAQIVAIRNYVRVFTDTSYFKDPEVHNVVCRM